MSLTPDTGSDPLGAALDRGGTVRTGYSDLGALDLENWTAANNRTFIQVDTVDCASGGELMDVLCDVFSFPEDSLSDWDDLDDQLGDLDVSPAEGLVVLWSNWDSIAVDDERAMAVAVDVLRTAAQSWCDDGIPWTVLVVGDGPAWDLPWAGTQPAPWDATDEDDEDDADDALVAFPAGSDRDEGADASAGSRR